MSSKPLFPTPTGRLVLKAYIKAAKREDSIKRCKLCGRLSGMSDVDVVKYEGALEHKGERERRDKCVGGPSIILLFLGCIVLPASHPKRSLSSGRLGPLSAILAQIMHFAA